MNLVVQRISRVTTVSTLVVAMSSMGQVGHADAVRLETTLGGFSVSVEAAPFKVLVDDSAAAVPRPTGSAIVEGDPNYTLASVATGPNARGLASTVWPGNLFGEGLAQVAPGLPAYPLKAEAKYPDQPYTANGSDGGQLSHASASGLDATGTASGAPANQPGGQVGIGGITSTSTATVTDKNVATGTALSEVSDVDLLGGVIHIGSVRTTLSVSSDGKKPVSSGVTTVSGLSIAGMGYTVDNTGAHGSGPGTGLPSLSPLDALQALGITVSGVSQDATKDSETATRSATGLVVSIDTTKFKQATNPVVSAIKGPYSTIVSTFVPPSQQGNFYYLLNATPKLTFILGAANGTSAAVLPITFDFPTTTFPQNPGSITPPVTSPGAPVDSGFVSGPAPALGPGPVVNVPPAVQQPVFQPPGTSLRTAASTTGSGFGGIGGGLLLLALGLSGAIGFGLLRFLNLAAGLPLGLGCRLGAPTTLPDFRSVTA